MNFHRQLHGRDGMPQRVLNDFFDAALTIIGSVTQCHSPSRKENKMMYSRCIDFFLKESRRHASYVEVKLFLYTRKLSWIDHLEEPSNHKQSIKKDTNGC